MSHCSNTDITTCKSFLNLQQSVTEYSLLQPDPFGVLFYTRAVFVIFQTTHLTDSIVDEMMSKLIVSVSSPFSGWESNKKVYRRYEAGVIHCGDLLDVLCSEGVVPHGRVHCGGEDQTAMLDVPCPNNASQQVVTNALRMSEARSC